MRELFFPMDLTWQMIGIVVLGVFLASFIDSMAGGGGIISVPIYFLAGLPAHLALGTNKLSAGIGTMVSTSRFIRNGYIDWKLGVPSVFLALRLEAWSSVSFPGLDWSSFRNSSAACRG